MAYKDFPEEGYWRTLETDTITRFGYFQLLSGTEIRHIMFTFYVNGLIATPFNVRINIYGNDDQAEPIFSSSWATFSSTTIVNNDFDPGIPYTDNWQGNILFDFPGYPLNPNIKYYMSVETSGYTRVADTFYVGINLDWYSEVNTQVDGPDEAGARIRIVGLRP